MNMELVTVLFAAVSSFAGLGALVFAFLTVRDTKALRREDLHERRVDRLQDAANTVLTMGEFPTKGGDWNMLRLRLQASCAGIAHDLPSVWQLVETEWEGTEANAKRRGLAMKALVELGYAVRSEVQRHGGQAPDLRITSVVD